MTLLLKRLSKFCVVAVTAISSLHHARAEDSARPTNLRYRLGAPNSLTRFQSAMDILSAKCVTCHRAGGSATNFSPYLTNQGAWVEANYVVPGNPQLSLLFKFLQGSGFRPAPFGTMPLSGTLTSGELLTIRSWIEQMSKTPDPSSTPQPYPTGVPSGELLMPSQNYVRLGDRGYVKSVLDEVFGPSAVNVTTAMVQPKLSIFGGACDTMNYPPATGQGGDTCPDVDVPSVATPFVPAASTPRAGSTMRVCNVLTFNAATLQYAIKNATKKSDLSYLSTSPVPTEAEILSAYYLFTPAAEAPPQSVITALLKLAVAAKPANYPACPNAKTDCSYDPWRYVFNALCYQPYWQVM